MVVVGAIAVQKSGVVQTTDIVRVKFWGSWNFTSQLFESFALGLWDEEGGEDTAQHEEGEDLHDVVDPWRGIGCGGAAGSERSNESLSDDSTDFSCGG